MNRTGKTLSLVILGALAVIFIACPGKVEKKKEDPTLQKVSRQTSGFSHGRHSKIFSDEQVACDGCHQMGFPLAGIKEEDSKKLSGALMVPGKDQCHICHYDAKFVANAPRKCSICHGEGFNLMPADHRFDWKTRHRLVSKLERKECANCHKDSFCTDCHLKRDDIRQRMHDRNYIYLHSVEARGNPRECSTCHTASWCKDCHYERGVTK